MDVPGGLASAQGLAQLREVDALAVVVRCFGADATPGEELADVHAELLLADLAVIEGALERAAKKARERSRARRWRRWRRRRRRWTPRRRCATRAWRAERDRGAAGHRAAHAEARGGGGEPRGGRRRSRPSCRRRRRRVRVDRGGDRRDGRRGGARAPGGVRRDGAGPRARDRGVLPGDRPDHVPHDGRGRDAGVGGPPRREGARGGRRDPHRPGARASSAPR